MKLTLLQLASSSRALAEFAADTRLPIRTAYWAGKVLKKANKELEDFNATRLQLAEKHSGGILTADKSRYDMSPEQLEDFTKELDELMEVEIELPGEPFTLERLGDGTLSPASMMALDWLIVEG